MAKLVRQHFKFCGIEYYRVNDIAYLMIARKMIFHKVGRHFGFGIYKGF